jgi:hypothetical protein
MTERIDELMIEAGARFEFLHGVHYDDFQYKKFAELIVKETMQVVANQLPSNQYLDVAHAVIEHFGVEE